MIKLLIFRKKKLLGNNNYEETVFVLWGEDIIMFNVQRGFKKEKTFFRVFVK